MDREQDGSCGEGSWGVGELSKKEREKGLMDMENSVLIVGGRGYKGNKW